jgi:CheY-like chemotaxis protein
MMRSSNPILLVEDDEIDVITVKRALHELHVANQVDVAADGEDAWKRLQNQVQDAPSVILLDLNMPRMSGLELLRQIKQTPQLKRIPVIILTTSKDERDKNESFLLGAAGYMVKPVDYWQFVEVIRVIDRYWTLSEMP